MHRSTSAPVLLATTGVVLALALSGCSSDDATAPVGVATTTATPTTGSPSSAAPSSSGAPSPRAASPSSAAVPSAGSPSAASGGGRCDTGSLSGSVEAGSGGAAGSVYVHLALRNTGSTTCTLQGWPGVSFVGDTDGTQIGNPATEDRASVHPTVTLVPGATAVAPLKITRADDHPTATCDPTSPDGLRVYPPGSKASLFVAVTDFSACRSTKVTILTVQAFVPEGQAAD